MLVSKKLLLCLGAAVIGSGAQAADLSIGKLAVEAMTYTTVAGATAAKATGSTYTGVGSIFVSTVSTATTGFGSLCTASMINSTTIISAAHCIYNYDEDGNYDPVTEVRFIQPSFGERNLPTSTTILASDWNYNPMVDKIDTDGTYYADGSMGKHYLDIGSGNDVSMITLSSAAVGDTYNLYLGNNPLGNYTEVGTGTIGGPQGTSTITDDYLKRTGSNIFELYGDDLFSNVSHGVALSDFDDGTAAHDVFGKLTQANSGLNAIHQTGVAGEANSSPGDSGGPEFNAAGQIVSVTSFGLTGAILQGYCGGTGAIDPYHYNAAGTAVVSTRTSDLSLCTNSSVGEIAGDTLVGYNIGFINNYLAQHGIAPVPEAATWMQMIAGFGLLGAFMRRSRAVRHTVRFS